MANIASVLGFTNVPNIDKLSGFKTMPYPHNASCEISTPVERAVVDPRNEVSIDSRTTGLSGDDELSITYLAQRESYLGTAILSSTDALDALTLVTRVTPGLYYQASTNKPYQFTPTAYLCQMFKYWRGDMIFRFKFICTRFHKGRVRITYDPFGSIGSNIPDYTTVFNEVFDIGGEQDIEVRIPYMQATTYMKTGNSTSNYNFAGTSITPNTTTSNGLLTMRVVNPLTGPVSNTAIAVLVFVRGAENLEFAWPRIATTNNESISPYTLQSMEVSYPVEPRQVIAGHSCNDGDPNRNLVHFGESIISFRPLIHRNYMQYTQRFASTASNTITVQNSRFTRCLKYSGFDTNAYWTANQVIGGGTAKYNFNRMNIPQLVQLLFIGRRGSMTYTLQTENNDGNQISNVSMKWYGQGIATADMNAVDTDTTTSGNVVTYRYKDWYKDHNDGVSITDQKIQTSIAVNFPYYSRFNFQLNNPNYAQLGNSTDDSDVDTVSYQVISRDITQVYHINVWAALGPDYNFFFLINCPSLYIYTSPSGT
eukprot:GHVR01115365.1.p1 GENE.GHVR01115365.1~~GHVR01115365.1.p1  ORF type:complete len:590 (-),score=52.08 GHVR01115365.1:52-1665(-)